jgi:hypothetical protein
MFKQSRYDFDLFDLAVKFYELRQKLVKEKLIEVY